MDLGPMDYRGDELQKLNEATSQLVFAMKNTEIYKVYKMQCSKINKQLDLKQRVDEYRQKNFDIQNGDYSGEQIMEKQDILMAEYSDILENPLITDFLAAELEFCRMVQNVNLRITEGLDFE